MAYISALSAADPFRKGSHDAEPDGGNEASWEGRFRSQHRLAIQSVNLIDTVSDTTDRQDRSERSDWRDGPPGLSRNLTDGGSVYRLLLSGLGDEMRSRQPGLVVDPETIQPLLIILILHS